LKKEDEGAVEIPIDGTLDLHTFKPSDVRDLVPEYLRECAVKGIFRVRIIHGKGTGVQARIVRSVLDKMPEVASFETAGPDEGDWGATIVRLKPESGDTIPIS
jgi:DNA-nicking Smr family endonuclease